MPGDLHTHTTFSDGSTPVGKMAFLARAAGLRWLAVSDHDSISSVRWAYANPEQDGVRLLPAAELSATDPVRGRRVHLLCYWPDDCAALQEFTALMAERRRAAALQSCAQLEKFFPQFCTDEVMTLAAEADMPYRAHIMRVLWQYGLADGLYNEVYHELFGGGGVPGKVQHRTLYEPVDAVLAVIRACRGVAVLAHPSVYRSMELARELIAAGKLDGVEIEHPRNTAEDKAELRALAKEYDLIVTGGTDYHGMNAKVPHPVGTCTTADDQIERINALAKARKS